jgi:parvulin-like peptidyl-prolyl isomerase
MLARLDAEAEADFDRRIDVFTARAREEYLVNRHVYVTPEQVEWSWIFVDTAKRGGDAAARGAADKARAALSSGAAFANVAQEYSDDRESAANGGRMPWATRAEIHPALAETVFAMKDVGEVSAAIPTRTGYHVVRLEGRKPGRQQTFDEVKARLLAKSKEAHVAAKRAARIEAISTDPGLRVDQAAVDALVTTVDPAAVRKALQSPPSNPPPN